MPGQTFSGSARTSVGVDAVWLKLDDARTWEGITGVDEVFDEVQDDTGRLSGFRFHSMAMGQRYTGNATPGPRDEGKSMTWNIKTPDLKGSVRVSLEAEGSETAVDVTMTAEPTSMMAKMGFPLITAAISNGFQESVDRFVEQLET